MDINGTAGNDDLSGTNGNDFFDMSLGGNDTASGLNGNDTFQFGAAFDAQDHVYGGEGAPDRLILDGNYSHGVVFKPDTMRGVESIILTAGNSYTLTFDDKNVQSGDFLVVDGSQVDAGHHIRIDGSAETAGLFNLLGSAGADVLKAGNGDDSISASGDSDKIYAGLGEDYVELATDSGDDQLDTVFFKGDNAFDAGDTVVGRGTVVVDGGYSGTIVLHSSMVGDASRILFRKGDSYAVDASDVARPSGTSGLTLDASALGAHDIAFLDGENADGVRSLSLIGGASDDTLNANVNGSILQGNSGSDFMLANSGTDTFSYLSNLDSTGPNCDTIAEFDGGVDVFSTGFATVAGFDGRVTSGTLRLDSFNADLAHAVGQFALHADHAVLFKADHGDLKGEWFIIVDANHKAGYQGAAHDLVVHLANPQNLGGIDNDNFVPAS